MALDTAAETTSHRWRFFRVGGLDLVRIETADDLRHLGQLDQKLWTALACPVKGLEFDEKTLAMIDTDKDGRVRAPELIAVVDWVCANLVDPGSIVKGGDAVAVANIKNAAIKDSAIEILTSLGKAGAEVISLGDVTDTAKIFAQTKFNGDGVVTAKSAGDDAATAIVIGEIVATVGGVPDRSGDVGVDAGKLGAFFDALAAYDAWTKTGDSATVQPVGDRTAAAAAALGAVRGKVDDFFARCRMAAFDVRALHAVNRQETEYLALAAKDLSVTADEIAGFPLARIEPNGALPLGATVNPAWAGAIGALVSAAVEPLLGAGRTSLTEADWTTLKSKLAPYVAWQAGKAGAAVEGLGVKRIRELLAGTARAAIGALLEKDNKLTAHFSAIAEVERLTRLHRDLHRLLLNFVSFSDLYDPRRVAIFQSGTLYIDARSFDLCIRVDAPHALVAMSKSYIAYCACTRPGGMSMTIAVCFTQGDSDYMFAGRHGLFYDRQGRDWDAVVTSIVDNPISVRQAFWAPYKKFLRMIEEQVAKRAAAAEAASDAKLAGAASSAANVDKAAIPPAGPKKVDVGMVAAIGVAISGAISALTLILGYVFGLAWWQYPFVLLGMMLVISTPSMLIAALKLRQRTLGPILDANGWAVNGRVKINIPFGTTLTERAVLPPGHEISLADPFAEKKSPWPKILIALFILGGIAWGIRWDHNRRGHYFWQPKPEVVAPAAVESPAAEAAPVAPAPAPAAGN